jgi:hypothetical protein
VVVVTSTYGDGGPPDNAEKLYRWLEITNAPTTLKYFFILYYLLVWFGLVWFGSVWFGSVWFVCYELKTKKLIRFCLFFNFILFFINVN